MLNRELVEGSKGNERCLCKPSETGKKISVYILALGFLEPWEWLSRKPRSWQPPRQGDCRPLLWSSCPLQLYRTLPLTLDGSRHVWIDEHCKGKRKKKGMEAREEGTKKEREGRKKPAFSYSPLPETLKDVEILYSSGETKAQRGYISCPKRHGACMSREDLKA